MASGDNETKGKMYVKKHIDPQKNLTTLVIILRDLGVCDQHERIEILFNDLLSALEQGFFARDLFNVTELMLLLLCRSEFDGYLNEYLYSLLELMEFVPLVSNASEILEFKVDIEEYFTFIGFVIIVSKELQFKKLAVRGTSKLLSNIEEGNVPIGAISKYWVHRCMENSKLWQIIGEYLSVCSDDIYYDLINVSCEIAKVSEIICLQMMESNALQYVMVRLDPDWQKNLGGPRPDHDLLELPGSHHLENPLMLLSILLDTLSKQTNLSEFRDKIQRPTVEALWGIRYALRVYTVDERKGERNFVLAVLLRFVDLFPNSYLLQSGLIDDIAVLATSTELPRGGHFASQIHFANDNDDFDFKRMLLMAIGQCFDKLGVLKVLRSCRFIAGICKIFNMFMDPDMMWSSEYYRELLLTVLFLMDRMMDQCADEFHDFCIGQISAMITHFLEENFDPEVLSALLKNVYRILNLNQNLKDFEIDEPFMHEIKETQRTVISLILEKPLNTANQNIVAQALANLHLIPVDKHFSDTDLIIEILKRFRYPCPEDVGIHSPMVINCLLLLWNVSTSRWANAKYFIKMEGIYLLLDLMKDSGLLLQLVGLGFLADVLEQGLGISYLVTWKKDEMTFLKLLLQIFRNECKELQVEWLPRGVISDLKFPIMGSLQKNHSATCELQESPSMTDMLLSCRPRIYAILQLLTDQRNETKFEVAEEYYRTFEQDVSFDDRITKLICENYFTFKVGESWAELDTKFKTKQVQLVPVDRFLLDSLQKYYHKLSLDIKGAQETLLKIEYKNEHYEEEQFYNLLRESKLQNAITGLSEMKILAQIGDPRFRGSGNINIKDEISKDETIGVHRTNHNINNFFYILNQKLNIQTDVISDPFPEVIPQPVSEDEELQSEEANQLFDNLHSDRSSLGIINQCAQNTDDENDV